MDNWFTIDQIDKKTYIISEYRHWEETHCYLLNGSKFSLLIDTGLGICDIHNEVKKLTDNAIIDIGNRSIQILHTPGHSPGHMCFWEKERGYLFTGDLVYKDTLFAYFPSTDPEAYLNSLELVAMLPVKHVFPAHHTLKIQPEILTRMCDAFRQLKNEGNLHHGSGIFEFGDWAVWL
ncbi:MBL fold metallo-hydrolase [Desulfobacter curvatus]|uniref:MBL fold metallo-hydrolase n=1 Tax=Desulfobacter curvatus TaxID=2290 RepID=UPI00036B6953|nr:MBL fold metallo-hydrolase [Desulfobacter curvatus]